MSADGKSSPDADADAAPDGQRVDAEPRAAEASAEAGQVATGAAAAEAPAPRAGQGAEGARRGGSRAGTWIAILAVFGLAALVVWAWSDARTRLAATQDEVALRLRDMETTAATSRRLAQGAQLTAQELRQRMERLDARLADAQAQQQSIEALYQELSRNREAWQLAEIEQIVRIATQQLELSGNVRAALTALQLAETRLARADRPQFLGLRKAIAHDIERLKGLPALDLAGLSLRVDGLVAAVDTLPLAFDERSAQTPRALPPLEGADPQQGMLRRVAAELWQEVRALVIVRRIDAPEPPLLAPSQAYFLRENLRLRLLSARLALQMRDQAGFRENLRLARDWVRQYFDLRSKRSADVLAQVAKLAATQIEFEAGGISGSLESVRMLQAHRERGS